MHSQLALTENVSLKLGPLILLDPVDLGNKENVFDNIILVQSRLAMFP